MGNSCHCCSRRSKTGTDEDPDDWEEHPDVVAAREKQINKKAKKKNKKKAAKYKPDPDNPIESKSEAEQVSPVPVTDRPLTIPKETIQKVGKHPKPELKELPLENQRKLSSDKGNDTIRNPKTITSGNDGSFVNVVFEPDEEAELEDREKVSKNDMVDQVTRGPESGSVSPEIDSGFSESPVCNSPSSMPERPTLSRGILTSKSDPKVDFMEVSDMGTQLSVEAGCYATQLVEGSDIKIMDSELKYPFPNQKKRKRSKGNLSKKLKTVRRKSANSHCDPTVKNPDENAYPFRDASLLSKNLISDVAPPDPSTLKVKFYTKDLRVPVYYMIDDVTNDDDRSKTTMTNPEEEDEDEGIEASEFTDAHERELLLAEVLKKRAAYEAAIPTVYPWLEETENQLKSINERPLPVEPSALQVQAKEVEQILQDVTNHSAAVQKLEDTASDVTTLPQEAIEDKEREEIRTYADTTRKRYEELRRNTSEKSADLNSALSKSQGVSERLESLLNWLTDLERQLQQNKSDTVAHMPKLSSRLDDANSIKSSIALREPEVSEVRNIGSSLLGGGDGQATDSLHKRMAQLANRFSEVEHGTSQRCDDLEQLCAKQGPFEQDAKDLLSWMETTVDKLSNDDLAVTTEARLPEVEAALKKIHDEVEAEQPSFSKTIENGESIVGDCRITDSSPVRDLINKLTTEWEDLKEILDEMEEEVTSRQKQLASLEKAMADFASWMKSVDDAVGDMKDSIVLSTLEAQIEKTHELLDKWEVQAQELDRIHDLASFDTKSTSSPSRRRLRAHRRKNRGMRKARARHNQKDGEANLGTVGANGKGTSSNESQLEEMNSMLDDLSDKISDKQSSLIEAKENRESFDKQAQDLDRILGTAEKEKAEWENDLESSDRADINEMKKKLAEHKKWRENLLSHANELRNVANLSTKLCEPKPLAEGVPEVQEQTKNIDSRWRNLMASSDDYVSGLESNSGALGDFNARAAQLKDWLHDKRQMLNMLGPTVCDKTILTTQNQQVDHLSKDVEGKKPHIEDLMAIASNLPNTEDVHQELSVIEGQWAELKGDLDSRKSDIDDMLEKVDELSKLSKEVCDWSDDIQKSTDEQMKKLDSVIDNLKNAEAELAQIRKEGVKPNATKVARCQELAKELGSPAHEKSTAAFSALDSARTKLDALEKTLKDGKENSKNFAEGCEDIRKWIEESYAKMKTFLPSLTEDDLLEKQALLAELQKEAEKKQEEWKDLMNCAEKLKLLCPADSTTTEKRKAEMDENMNKLIEAISKAVQEVIDLLQRLHEFENLHAELEEKIVEGENQLEAHKMIPHEAKTDRHVEALKILQGEVASMAPQVVYLTDFGAELIAQSPKKDDETTSRLTDSATDVSERFRALKKSLDAECGKLADTVEQTERLQEKVTDLVSRLNDLEEEWEKCEPVTREVETLEEQRDQMTILKEKLHLIHLDIAELNADYKVKVANGDVMDDYNLQREIELLARKDQRMQARFQQRWEEILRISEQVKQFFDTMDDVITKIDEIMTSERKLGNVPSTTEDIIEQQKQFEKLRQNCYEPLQAKVQQLHYSGHGLVISAAPSVPTSHISDALNELDNLWNELSNSMNVRSLSLQRALLSCGRFQDVYASLSSWLRDAEQLAASQKSPSWEYKVLLAQMEEQKVLQKMVASHQEAVSSFLRDGSQLSSSASLASRAKIDQQLQEFKERWDALCDKVKAREAQLKSMIGDAKRFHETTEDFCTWLEETERSHANNDVIGTQVERIQEQLIEQQKLMEDILKHQRQLTDITDTPLIPKTAEYSPELLQGLQTKTDLIQARYDALKARVEGRTAILRENLRLCRLFNEDHLRLFAFLSEAELRLQDGQSTLDDARPPPVKEVLHELEAIHEQIMAKKSTVDSALAEGKQLMMKCSGQDTIQVQDKLESIKTKYADLQARSSDRVATLERSLTFSEEMEKSHNALTSWLDEVESSLRQLGLDVTDDDATRQRKSITGDDKKKLDDLIQTINPSEKEPALKSVKKCSKELLRVASRWGDEPLQSVVAEDEARFNAVKAALQRHENSKKFAEEKLENFFEHAAACARELDALQDKLNDFVTMTSLDPEYIKEKIDHQKDLNEELSGARSRVHSVSEEGRPIIPLCNEEDKAKIEECLEDLEEKLGKLSEKYNSSLIERTLPLAASYIESKDELLPWMEQMKNAVNSFQPPGILSEELKQQQDEVNGEMYIVTLMFKALRDDVVEHRPYVDKLNKTGSQLAQLIVGNNPSLASKVVKYTDGMNKSYASIREAARARTIELEKALGESDQFFERMKALLDQLDAAKAGVALLPPVVIEADKIKERIDKIKLLEVDLGKLLPTYNSLKTQGENLLARSNGNALELSKKVIHDKLNEMEAKWIELGKLIEGLLSEYLALLAACQQFWNDADSLHGLLSELDTIIGQEVGEPAVDLVAIKQQMEVLETLCEEMGNLEKDLVAVRQEANELCSTKDTPRQPGDTPASMEVKRVVDELDGIWAGLQENAANTKRRLENAMTCAVEYKEAVQRMLDLVREACEKVDNMSAVATDLDTLKNQLEELKDLRAETHSHQMELESLCNQGEQMAARAKEEPEKESLRASVGEMREAWRELSDRILQRQHDLESALLALGQLHHAINELAAWLDNTEKLLDSQELPPADNPKQIEIELAKHKILWNDIAAHKATLDSISAAAHEISSSSIDAGATPKKDGVEGKMEHLNSQWEDVNAKAQARQWELEECLEKAQGRQQELDLLTRWLTDKENELNQTYAYGGLPETALEQLNNHLAQIEDLEKKKQLAAKILRPESGQVEAELFNEKLRAVEGKMSQRKAKLEEVLEQARNFHNNLQEFMKWLSDAEKKLDGNSPPSAVLQNLEAQMEKHKEFENDVHAHRDMLLELDKTGSHLKYFSQKQDGILIKNLLLSVHGRWDKVTSRTSERSHVLNEGHKRAKQFYDARDSLCQWLDDSRQSLEDNYVLTRDPDKIKAQLNEHKEFQRAIASKRPVYDGTTRSGKALRDKAHTYGDKSHVDDKIRELKEKWDSLCAKSAERQNTLEEALMTTGRLIDAIESLLDWLYKTEPSVTADVPVHGDVHTVANLIDQHNALLNEIKTREAVVQSLEASAREMSDGADSSWVKGQMQDLLMRWEALCKFATVKEARLGSAKAQAEEFQVSSTDLLDWLATAETSLHLNKPLPDDEFQLQELKASNQEFLAEVDVKKNEMERTLALGNSILEQAHPDAIAPLKQWITILESRWEEVVTWAKQHGEKLEATINEMEANAELMEKLMAWLKEADATLDSRDAVPLPPAVEDIEKLITEHQAFQDGMLKLQPDYDRLSKTCKRKPSRAEGLKKRKSTDVLSDDDSPGSKLHSKWQRVWLKVLERQQKLEHAKDMAKQLESMESFSFEKWRSRYMKWMKNKKSRVMDFFRKIDTDGDGKITRQEFIDGIIKSKFPTTEVEMTRVADIFDQDKDGYIDYYEFVAALHPNKESYKPATDADKIEDEVVRQVAKCTCCKRFQVQQISENKYRFGDNQQLRLVRILRSTVMVRVGGGWMALDEFLVKNDPCRAKGRTNTELRERFILPAGSRQTMTAFRTRRSGTPRSLQGSLPVSRGSSRTTSPSRTNTPDPFSPISHESNGHGDKSAKTRSRASSGSSELSAESSLSSGGGAAHSGASSPPPSAPLTSTPSRYSAPTASSASKSRISQSGETPKRSKIPTKGTARKKL